MKTQEIHKPFIKSLVFLGLVTLVSMVSARILIENYMSKKQSTPIFTSQKSQSSMNDR